MIDKTRGIKKVFTVDKAFMGNEHRWDINTHKPAFVEKKRVAANGTHDKILYRYRGYRTMDEHNFCCWFRWRSQASQLTAFA
jgi:hypothetical protein